MLHTDVAATRARLAELVPALRQDLPQDKERC